MTFLKSIVAVMAMSFLLPVTVLSADYKQYTNLPTVYIDTQNKAPITSKTEYVPATLRYVDATGVTTYDALGIRGRGNSTWGLGKKPYRIKFDKKQTFLGKDHAKAKSWTLLANHTDKTLMRNAVASFIGELAGQPFNPAACFVDLVLNGKYIGNYQISDQIEVREKRVDIPEQDEPATATSNITGGYLLEVDGFAESERVYFVTEKGVMITIKSPDDEIINDAQLDYIANYIQEFETALFSKNFTDPEKGYRKYVDPETLASWFVASEITINPDMYWSVYIYKKPDDPRIYWGPMWDHDIAFNNSRRKGDLSNSVMWKNGFGQDLAYKWINRMWQDPWFVALVDAKWKEMKAMDFEKSVLAFIDEKVIELNKSQQLNFEIWPIDQRVYDEYKLFNTYQQGVEFMKQSFKTHNIYLDSQISRQVTALSDIAGENIAPTPAYDRADQSLVCDLGSGTVEVYNLAGALMMRAQLSDRVGVSLLPAGAYVAVFQGSRGSARLKFIK